jgi:hypothetical protein
MVVKMLVPVCGSFDLMVVRDEGEGGSRCFNKRLK